jgi:hypothetical protein
MKKESRGPRREGVSAWIYSASFLLALIAAIAVVVGNGKDGAVRLGLSGDGILMADDDGREPVVVDDDPREDSPTQPVAKPRGVTILASLSSKPAEAAPRPDPAVEARRSAELAIERAKLEIEECRVKYQKVRDYSCVFHKHERIDGKLVNPHIMSMKARTEPSSIYFKFVQPNRGREAIYDPSKHDGKILAHDVGLGKFLAGTMVLDPKGSMAMEENRHPISEAGIGALIKIVSDRWNAELDPSESTLAFHPHAKVGDRPCTMIESTHNSRRPEFFFYQVKVFIDHEHGLPIRFEAYDWPKAPGEPAELVEEYTYADLKVDVGLTDRDFDTANPAYSFGRF